jgi:hypothetical protein
MDLKIDARVAQTLLSSSSFVRRVPLQLSSLTKSEGSSKR